MKLNLIFVLLDVLLIVAYPILQVTQKVRRLFRFKN